MGLSSFYNLNVPRSYELVGNPIADQLRVETYKDEWGREMSLFQELHSLIGQQPKKLD